MARSILTVARVRSVLRIAAQTPHASCRSVAAQTGVSKSAVGRILLCLSRRGIALEDALKMKESELSSAIRLDSTSRPRDPAWRSVFEARCRGASYRSLYAKYLKRMSAEPTYCYSTFRRHYLKWLESRGLDDTPRG